MGGGRLINIHTLIFMVVVSHFVHFGRVMAYCVITVYLLFSTFTNCGPALAAPAPPPRFWWSWYNGITVVVVMREGLAH